MTGDLDNNTTIELDTLLSTLDDFVSDCDSITCLELRELLAGCKCFFSNFNQIHFLYKIKNCLSFQRNMDLDNTSAQTTAVTPKSGCKVTTFSCISQIFSHFLHFFPLFFCFLYFYNGIFLPILPIL